MRLPCRRLSLKGTHTTPQARAPPLDCYRATQQGIPPDQRCLHKSEGKGHRDGTLALRSRWHWGCGPEKAQPEIVRADHGKGQAAHSSPLHTPSAVPSSLPLTGLAGAVRVPRQQGTGLVSILGWVALSLPGHGALALLRAWGSGRPGVHSPSTVRRGRTGGGTMRSGAFLTPVFLGPTSPTAVLGAPGLSPRQAAMKQA